MRGGKSTLKQLFRASVLFVIFISLLQIAFPIEQDISIFESEELIINQTISTKIDLKIAPGSSLNWISANFSFLPSSDSRQEVITQSFYPDISKRSGEWVVYQWKAPKSGELEYSVSHLIRTKNEYEPVTGKVPYPVSKNDYDSSFYLYTQPTDLIDINDEIRSKAKELAGSSTDLFEVTFAIADWVTSNIDYDLNSITADAAQKATWVLETRTGVCDELSTLFMAMIRSLDIPVRFVSGVSYTTSSLFDEPWNAHAWSEVYFPNHGWVPFDLTYNQFGYIDASHIKLKVSDDADDSTTKYLWEGHNLDGIEVSLNDLEFKNDIISTSGKTTSDIVAEARLLKNEISFGSYGMIELKLTNQASHYVANTFFLTSAQELEFINPIPNYPILLKPLQTKYIYIPFKLSNSFDKNSKYTIPISYYDLQLNQGSMQLTTYERAQKYSFADMRVLSAQAEELADNENELESFSLGCSPDVKNVYVNESLSVTCFSEQTKSVYDVSNVSICFLEECKIVSFSGSTQVSFNRTFTQIGEVNGLIRLKIGSKQKTGVFSTIVSDKAILQVRDLTAPTQISYGDSLNITFLIKKESYADAENVFVRVGRVTPSVWNFGTVALNQNMTVSFTSEQMVPGENVFTIAVTYFDGEFEQEITETITVDLINVPFLTKIWLYILDIFE